MALPVAVAGAKCIDSDRQIKILRSHRRKIGFGNFESPKHQIRITHSDESTRPHPE
jgi:hypothetical protein